MGLISIAIRFLGKCLLPLILLIALLLPPAGVRPLLAAPAGPLDTPASTVVSETDFDAWTVGAGLVYWSKACRDSNEFPEDGYLRRKPVGGGVSKSLGTFPSDDCLTTNRNMTSTPAGLYYFNATAGQIEFRPSNGFGNPAPVYVTNQPPIAQAPLVVVGDYIYWISTDNRIVRVDQSGQNFKIVANTGANPNSLAVFANDFYWLDSGGLWQSTLDCLFICAKTNVTSAAGEHLIGVAGPGRYDLYWVELSNPARLRTLRCTFLFVKNCTGVTTRYTADTLHPWEIGRPATDGTRLFWIQTYGEFDPFNGGEIAGSLYRMPREGGAATEIGFDLGAILQPAPPVYADASYVYFADQGIKKLPVDASAIEHDLAIAGLEITQGIQNLANDVPLVAEKPTYVRAYGKQLQGPASASVNALLHGTRNGQPLPGSPLAATNGALGLAVGKDFDRAQLNDGWYFKLPTSWLAAGAIQLRLVLDPNQHYVDSNRANNEAIYPITFQTQGPVCTIFIPVRTETALPTTDDPNFAEMIERYQRYWPVPDVWTYLQPQTIEETELCWWGPFPYPCSGSYELDDESLISDNDRLLFDIMVRAITSDDPDECDDNHGDTHYIGMVHRDSKTGGRAGFANFHINASWVKSPADKVYGPEWNTMWAGNTLAQETAHNHDRWHVDCGDPDYVDTNYPYPGCQLDDTGQDKHYGFYGPTLDPIAPDAASDFMSYGNPVWVSDYTWKALLNSFASTAAVQSASAPSALASPAGAVLAIGYVDATGATGSLERLYLVPDGALSAGVRAKWLELVAPRWQTYQAAQATLTAKGAQAAPNYHLRLLDSNGTVLEDRALVMQENDNHHGNQPGTNNALFSATFPAPVGTVAKIELLADDQVLDSLTPGSSTPTVTLVEPTLGAQINEHLTIRWQAADADNDPLAYTVQYSADNGAHWQAVVTDFAGQPNTASQSVTVDNPLALPGSNGQTALVRVLASDGYNTGLAVSQPFTVVNRKPTPAIMLPTAEHWWRADQIITLRGDANDVEDGGLTGASLQWQVAGQSVGTGEEVDLTGWGAGVYPVTLTATDSAGQAVAVQSTLQIAPLGVPAGSTPAIDGQCDDSGYSTAVALELQPYADGTQATVHLLRTNDALWACFSGLHHGAQAATSLAGLYVDVDQSGGNQAQSNDLGFMVGEDGGFFVQAGNGAGGFTASDSAALQAQVSAAPTAWSAELRIAATALGGWEQLVGLSFHHATVDGPADSYGWPIKSTVTAPSSWSAAALGELPYLQTVTPNSATVGDQPFTLSLHGQNFGPEATVYWQETPLLTTVSSSTTLSATLTAAQLTLAGEIALTVRNTVTTELVSAPLPFTVVSAPPTITSLTPGQAVAEGSDFQLTVNGSNFVAGAQLLWEGEPLATTVVNSGQLTALVTAAHLAQGRTVGLAVTNPAPSAGASNTQPFVVAPINSGTAPKIYLPLVTR